MKFQWRGLRLWVVALFCATLLVTLPASAQWDDDDWGDDGGDSDWGDDSGDSDWGDSDWDDGSDSDWDDGDDDDWGVDQGNGDSDWDDGDWDDGSDSDWDDGDDDDWGVDQGNGDSDWDDGSDWGDGGYEDDSDWGNGSYDDSDVWDSGYFYDDWSDEYWYEDDFTYGDSWYNEYYSYDYWSDPYYWYSYYDTSWYSVYRYYPWEVMTVWPYGYLVTSCSWRPNNWGYGWCYNERVYYTWCAWNSCGSWTGDPRVYCRYNNCVYQTRTRPTTTGPVIVRDDRGSCALAAGEDDAMVLVPLMLFGLVGLAARRRKN